MHEHDFYIESQSTEDHIRIIQAQIDRRKIPKAHGYRQQNRVHFHECPSPWCQRARRRHYKNGCKLDRITKCYPCKQRAGAA